MVHDPSMFVLQVAAWKSWRAMRPCGAHRCRPKSGRD